MDFITPIWTHAWNTPRTCSLVELAIGVNELLLATKHQILVPAPPRARLDRLLRPANHLSGQPELGVDISP